MNALRIIVAFAALMATGPAWAHAQLRSSRPVADTTAHAPAVLELHFSQGLAKESTVTLTGADGKEVALKPVALKDSETLTVTPATPLAPGKYTVSWTAITNGDGHTTHGTYAFTVE